MRLSNRQHRRALWTGGVAAIATTMIARSNAVTASSPANQIASCRDLLCAASGGAKPHVC